MEKCFCSASSASHWPADRSPQLLVRNPKEWRSPNRPANEVPMEKCFRSASSTHHWPADRSPQLLGPIPNHPAAGRWGRDDFNESECLQQRIDVEIHAFRPALLIHQVDLRLHQHYQAWARDRIGCGSARDTLVERRDRDVGKSIEARF